MPKYARIIGGKAIDVFDAESPAELEARMGVSGFVEVPAEAVHGSPVTVEDGTVVGCDAPMTAPPPDPAPKSLTPNQVIDLMLATIGAAGFAACVRSDADAMVTWRYKMSVARDISKAQAAAGLSIIVAATLMTAEQRTAILAAWPAA